MILIFTHTEDYSVKVVIEWLDYFNEKWIRINDEKIQLKDVSINNKEINYKIKIADTIIDKKDIKSIWFRGGKIDMENYYYFQELFNKPNRSSKEDVLVFLSNYSYSILEFLEHAFSDSLGKNRQGRFNKLTALNYAREVGLEIPESLVTTSKEKLVSFYNKHKQIITKSLDLNFGTSGYLNEDKKLKYNQFTSLFTEENLRCASDSFPLTLFQPLIEKSFEIRTFYMYGKCYSTAIFSQQNEKTKVDFRQYDESKMNRTIPFKFPIIIEKKIIKLMNKCELNTGSLDFICSNGNYYFLEINPIGQFGWAGDSCNYYLHREIALNLMKKQTKNAGKQ